MIKQFASQEDLNQWFTDQFEILRLERVANSTALQMLGSVLIANGSLERDKFNGILELIGDNLLAECQRDTNSELTTAQCETMKAVFKAIMIPDGPLPPLSFGIIDGGKS